MSESDNETVVMPREPETGSEPQQPATAKHPDEDFEEPPSGMSCLVKGCLISLVLGVILGALAWWGVNWAFDKFVAEAGPKFQAELERVIDKSEFTDEEKTRLKGSAKQITDRMAAGDISFEQVGRLIEQAAEGPLLMLFAFDLFENHHVANSGLDETEKADAARLMDRLLRGHVDKSVPSKEIQQLWESFPKERVDGQDRLKEKLTDTEIRDLLTRIRETVDANSIPDEDFEIDIVDEIDRAISEALGP